MKILEKSSLEHVYKSPDKGSKHLMLLHGYGANELDLFSLGTYIPGEWGIVSLRAPIDLPWGGHAWYHIGMEGGGLRQDLSSAFSSLEIILRAIEEFKEKTAPEKLVIMGFSQGAILGWSIALQNPDMIDGLAAISGYWNMELMGREGHFDHWESKDIFMSHGRQDEVIDISLPQQSVKELKERGLDVELRTYAQGHGIGPENLEDFLLWLSEV
jgi:phospholipase/carboxylesterase